MKREDIVIKLDVPLKFYKKNVAAVRKDRIEEYLRD
jgi:hypothetical protein